MIRACLPYLTLVCVAITLSGCRTVPPPPGTITVWNRLGIPQAMNTTRDNLINRRGNRPNMERKPPIKRIADPANLESPNPAIKAAAEIKKEEDLAPQKIKALKYLGTLGCGCYDKEGKVEAALLAGLADCTEDVRKTAAETVLELVGDCCCHDGCGNNCCTEKIQEKLQDIAYGETDGCYHEPSAEVRQIAMQALSACPPLEVTSSEGPAENRETAPEPVPPGTVPPPAPLETSVEVIQPEEEMVELTSTEAPVDFYAPINVGFVEEVPLELVAPEAEISPVSAEAEMIDAATQVFISDDAVLESSTTDVVSLEEELVAPVALPVVENEKPEAIQSRVELINQRDAVAMIQVSPKADLKVGQTLNIEVHSKRGNHTIEGQVVVVEVSQWNVQVRPVNGLALKVLRPGSQITLNR